MNLNLTDNLTEEQQALVRNPLIQNNPSDTLHSVESVLIFVQDYLFREELDAKITLRQTQIEGLYHVNEMVLNAVAFEAERIHPAKIKPTG